LARAEAFCETWNGTKAYGSYDEMLADPAVDAVYVATPHPFHKGHTVMALNAGKAVLCEKPMSVNAGSVAEMAAVARDKGLFLMEAMWTRYLPTMVQARQWIAEGRIGQPMVVTADFGFRAQMNPEGRLFNLNLAGGALLDVGVYVIAMGTMVFGAEPRTIKAVGQIGETSIDEQTSILLDYVEGGQAVLNCSVRATTPHEMRIVGTEGSILLPAFWHGTEATLFANGQEPVVMTGDQGYHFEAAEVARCLREGLQESPVMPLDESIQIAEIMDEVRRQIGLTYPWDN